MDRKPLQDVREKEDGERTMCSYTGQGSEMLPPVISPEGVHHGLPLPGVHHGLPECALPLSESNNWNFPPLMPDRYQYHSMMHAQNSTFPNQLHHVVYYPPVIHAPNLGPPHFGQQSCPTRGSHASPVYHAIDSRGSLSSFSSSDTTGSSARRRRNHGMKQRRRAGSPPNRARYYYDENATFYQMIGRIVEIAQDRGGSKLIQRRLQVADTHEMQIAFNEVLDGIEELWDDVYGNYILQAYLELGTNEMRDSLGRKIVESDVFVLSTKVYGCRLIQKALETLAIEDVVSLVGSLKGKVLVLIHDHNGNHVIQRAITKIYEFCNQSQIKEECAANSLLLDTLDIIISEVTININDLVVHPYGCRVVQRLIENCHGDQKIHVLESILKDGLLSILVNHEYGNYVVQRVLTYGRACDRAAIFDEINTNTVNLSKQKHSSNVVEMMLTYGNAEQRQQIIDEIINGHCVDQHVGNCGAAVSMAGDAYANYVIKRVLEIIDKGPKRERLFDMLLSDLGVLQQSRYAKQVVLRVNTYSQESRDL